MTNIIPLWDRLSNLVSGLGTTADKNVYHGYNMIAAMPQQVEASYRSSWLMRKIVDLPASDMTRAWRAWQADRDIIQKLEKEERRHKLKIKAKRAIALARLWGGSAIVIGVKGQGEDQMQPLSPDAVKLGGLSYLHVFARHQFTIGELITDPESPWFGEPEYYRLTLKTGNTIEMHPSRVIPFIGQPAPDGSQMQADSFWGDPLFQSIQTAIENADLSQEGFATLINEAKLDIIKIPDLMALIGTSEYETRLKSRLQTANTLKSIINALIIDGDEEWDQRQITWAGIPDIIITYLQIVAGAADIPVTRLLGQSPKGLQSTGEGEEKDYHAMIETKQDEMLSPALDRIDDFLIRSALGNRPEEIWYRLNPLVRLTPQEAAEIENKRADTVSKYAATGLIESAALSQITKNAITESGQWPGSDEAFDEAGDIGEMPPEDDPEAVAEVTES